MSDPITAIRQAHAAGTCLSGACVWHEHVGTLLTAYDGRSNDALSMELQRDQALRECVGLREALSWALENGAHYFNGTLFTETDQEPPAHLAPILAEAMRSKS